MYRHGAGYRFVGTDGTKVSLGTDYPTALQRYAELVVEHLEGSAPLRTVGDAIERYRVEVLPTKAPSTQTTNGYELDKLKSVFGNMQPASVLPKHIYGYMTARGAPVRANREVSLLSHVFSHMIRWGAADTNPCASVMKNKEKPRTRLVTDEEFWAVYDLASERMRIAMLLMVSCGFRGSELRTLRWEQVTDEYIEIKRGKGGKLQRLLLNDAAREALAMAQGLRRFSQYVLSTRVGQPYTKDGLQANWARLMKAWGGDRFQMRDLRAKSGSDHDTGRHLGHQSDRVLNKHYRRAAEDVAILDIRRNIPNGKK